MGADAVTMPFDPSVTETHRSGPGGATFTVTWAVAGRSRTAPQRAQGGQDPGANSAETTVVPAGKTESAAAMAALQSMALAGAFTVIWHIAHGADDAMLTAYVGAGDTDVLANGYRTGEPAVTRPVVSAVTPTHRSGPGAETCTMT